MLLKANRLKKKKDIERSLKKGKRFQESFIILKTVKNDLGVLRFGFMISQKVSKKAVIRNKIRRRLQEITKKRVKKTKTGIDNLFIALPGLERKDFKEIESIIDKLFKKAGLFKND